MNKSKSHSKEITLTGSYKMKSSYKTRDYKAEYNRMFPTKMSSSNFLMLYTLFLLNKSPNPLYGKQMLNKIQEIISEDIWNPSHGTYYPLLESMERDNLIEKQSTKLKNYYSITELGKNELKLRLDEFSPMIMGGIRFFNNILIEMYNNDKGKVAKSNNVKVESSPKTEYKKQKIEISINSITADDETKGKNQYIEINVIDRP